eukprot:NODE_5640_length_630_cov_27.322068_g5476_i0.p1 GENE.NODE_5640_length_630_cov_27.322068_g5476_i0~~NODE_5640_length_630_cov_27.322068_g5476_i0.p1  ORF type:complete len:133 (-),score=29.26 NODE_5640_length_630_cov_27.322068_g5476_i0:149-547(-)
MNVEVKTRDGYSVGTYDLTPEQQAALPKLDAARQSLADGNAMEAFRCLLDVIRDTQGEAAILPTLDAARDQHAKQHCDKEVLSTVIEANGTLLEETGQEGVVLTSLKDGSSVICKRCQGVVKIGREEAHSEL